MNPEPTSTVAVPPIQIGRAFKFIFEDPKWVSKTLIGTMFVFLSTFFVGIPFALGYHIELIRNVHNGEAFPLPAWDNLGRKFSDGLKFFIVILIYESPIFVVYAFIISIFIAMSAASSRTDGGAYILLFMMMYVITIFAVVGYGMVIYLLLPAITIAFARTGSITQSLRIKDLFRGIRRSPGPYITAVAVSYGAGMLAEVGLIAFFVGVFFTAFLAYAVSGYMCGQIWKYVDGSIEEGEALNPRIVI